MSDPVVIPAAAQEPSKIPMYIGILCVLIYAGLMGAILFFPKAEGVTDAVTQQIITATVALVSGFTGWIWGSSQSSQRKDAAITALTPPKG